GLAWHVSSHEWDVTAIEFVPGSSRRVERRGDFTRSLASAVQQRFEESGVEVIRFNPNHRPKPDACRPFEASAILDSESATGRDAGVRSLAREIDADIAPDVVLLGAAAELPPVHVDECHPDDDARRDVRGKVMAHAGVPDREPRANFVVRPVMPPIGRKGDRDARAHHFGVVDPAPEVASIGHVAILAMQAARGCRARAPLLDRVFQRLAVERETVSVELVTARAELGDQEGRRPDRAAMRDPGARRRRWRAGLAARRTETPVL